MSEQFTASRGLKQLAALFLRENTHVLPEDYGLAADYRNAFVEAGPLAEEWANTPDSVLCKLLQVVDIYRRKLDATEKARDEARMAVSLACEMHGCGSENCTAAQYHEDAQKLFKELSALQAEVVRLSGEPSVGSAPSAAAENASQGERALAATEQELLENAPVEDYIRELDDKPIGLTDNEKTLVYGNLRGFWSHINATAAAAKAVILRGVDRYVSLHYPKELVTAEDPLPVLVEGADEDLYTEASGEFHRTRPLDVQYDAAGVREIWLRMRRERQLQKVLDQLQKQTSEVNVHKSNLHWLAELFGVSDEGEPYVAWKARRAEFAQMEMEVALLRAEKQAAADARETKGLGVLSVALALALRASGTSEAIRAVDDFTHAMVYSGLGYHEVVSVACSLLMAGWNVPRYKSLPVPTGLSRDQATWLEEANLRTVEARRIVLADTLVSLARRESEPAAVPQ